MSLEMKYFVLKPRAKKVKDPFAVASQKAMKTFADNIQKHDSTLALELRLWATNEAEAQAMMRK